MTAKFVAGVYLPVALLTIVSSPLYAADAFDADSPWMLGDWGGLRSELLEKGYKFNIQYTGEGASNVKGGYSSHTTGRYSDQLTLGTNLDLQKVFGWNDSEFQLTVTERSGRNLTNEGIADPRAGGLTSVQEVYGRGQTWRLTQLWYRQGFLGGALDIKLGRVGVGEDFGSFSCKFQNLAFCGAQIGNWAGDAVYNWPVSQWGGRLKIQLAENTFVQAGAYEQNPSYLETGNAFKLSGSGNEGTLFPVELVHSTSIGEQRLPGEFRAGAYYSTRSWSDVYDLENGQPEERNRKYGYWIVGKQQVYQDPDFAARGLTLFANATLHDKETSFIDRYVQVGLFYSAPFASRPDDEIGVGLARIHVNDRVRNAQQRANAQSGAVDYADPIHVPLQGSETSMEIYYGFAATKWLTLRPNIQIIADPGGVDQVSTAWVAGLKLETSF